MNKSRVKGTWLENAAVEALRTRWPDVERRAQRGINDAGDIAGTPLTIECKYTSGRIDLAGWWKEAQRESQANGGKPPVVIAKRKGNAKPLEQWVVMDVATLLRIIPQREGMQQ